MNRQAISYGRQTLDDDDLNAVIEALKSPMLTQGPGVLRFEERLADYCGAKYALAVINGTAALYLANKALGVLPGDKVITTPNTFAASANSVALNGGTPIFADIRNDTFNIDPDEIEKLLVKESRVKGLIPVHFAGVPADLERMADLAKKYNLFVIEDACHGLGGEWIDSKGRRQKVGNCAYSDLSVFSFHPVKHITTGEGGAITTNNEKLYKKLLQLRSHGITSDPLEMTENHGNWYYEMQELSFNFRITDIQCALGYSQLARSDHWIKRRNEIVDRYDSAFDGHAAIAHQRHPGGWNLSYHLYVIQCDKRDELYTYLHKNKIYVQVHYVPVHLHPYYKNTFDHRYGDFPKCELYYSKALSLPLYPTLSEEDQSYVIDKILEFYRAR